MKRCEFLLHPDDHKAVSKIVRGNATTFSDFIRQAVIEKLGREHAVARMELASEQLASLVQDMRMEFGRTRKDLMDDQQRGIELMRQDIGKSMKKNEEMNKTFVMMLGGQVAPATPAAPQQRPRGPGRSDDAPMKIPG